MISPRLQTSILVIITVCAAARAQTKQRPPVNWPDLSKLEEGVREQLTSEQNALTAVIKNPAASLATLSEAYGKLGQIYHAYALTAAARVCYLKAIQIEPKQFRWIYLLAKLDHQEGRFQEALDSYGFALASKPDYVPLLINQGNLFLELNRLDDATVAFNKALTLDKNNAAALYGQGQVALSLRNYADAARYFEQTLAEVPGANRVHYSLAMAYRGLKNAEKAKAHLAQQGTVGVRVSDPLFDGLQDLITGERVYLSRGKVAFEAQRYAEAVNEFRKAVAAKPNSVTARINLGAALTQTGDAKGAAEQFEEALRIDPGKANAHYNLAVILAGQNKHDQAITHLRLALSAEPNDVNARLLLAQQLKKSGNLDEALAEYSRVVQADPANESALLEQVKLFYHKRQFKAALDALEKSRAQYPKRGQTVLLLAYLLAASPETNLRNGTRALDLAQLVFASTSAPQHGALVALAFAELGRCNEAAQWQRRMIAAAEQNKNTDLLLKLQTGLKQYENVQSCRPENEAILSELFFSEKN
ncbi:MAG TPA: tetratricopeptide repeat protein [Pyrinomonadaceae bacterium]|nr:tetratricopeptide repeat protein [Pyrinomonadaceae bacterium]